MHQIEVADSSPFSVVPVIDGVLSYGKTSLTKTRTLTRPVDSDFSLGAHLNEMLIGVLIVCMVVFTTSSPLPSSKQGESNRILYDQRQEGEWNVRADLKNFLILIIPTPTVSTAPNPPSLLDFFTKSMPTRTHTKKTKHPDKNENLDAAQETMHFIESKTAPYHVDITKTKEELAKLHPSPEEVLVASSPKVALLKPDSEVRSGRGRRFSRAFVFTVPADEEFVVSKTEDNKTVVKKDGKRKIHKKVNQTDEMKLLGADYEQCGPGIKRDAQGICRIIYENIDNM